MGSDREGPGGGNPNGPNGVLQALDVEQKHWPGPLICMLQCRFMTIRILYNLSPKSGKWHFRESTFKNFFCVSMPWAPYKTRAYTALDSCLLHFY
jgi:hypothetical protein